MHQKAKDEHELLDLVSIWTFELLDNSISIENYYQLENTLLQSTRARESFVQSMKLHRDLIGMFNDTPTYLEVGLQRAVDLVEFVQVEVARELTMKSA